MTTTTLGVPMSTPAGPGAQDPLAGDLRKAGLLPLLVLHFAARDRCYGHMLVERIGELTHGALAVHPNTMHPILPSLHANGLIEGRWEHPERRSRRFYSITAAGEAERIRLARELAPRLERIQHSIETIRDELLSAA